MATVKQPSANPTRKLAASVLATAAVELTRAFVDVWFPGFGDAALWMAITPAVALGVGYYVKDAPNVSVDPDYERG